MNAVVLLVMVGAPELRLEHFLRNTTSSPMRLSSTPFAQHRGLHRPKFKPAMFDATRRPRFSAL